jgi:translation initiation factor IF-1
VFLFFSFITSQSRMPEEHLIEIEGRIIQVLPGTMFRVELPNKHIVLGRISGKLRKNFIKIFPGDLVKLEMNPSDITQARITYRMRNGESSSFRSTSLRPSGNSGGYPRQYR